MKKIAFVVQRYGEEVTGGAEAECRMYAERLTRWFQVEALTTCAIDHLTWADHYAPGVSTLNGVTVRRFSVPAPRNLPEFFKLSTPLMDGSDLSLPAQQRWLDAMGPNCPGLLDYIRDHSEEYAAVLFMTYLYPTALDGIRICKAPKLLIPTAHDEWALYLSSYRNLFEAADGYIYNSEAEHRLVDSVFLETCGKPTVTVGAGVEMPSNPLPDVRERFGLTKPYLCYCGRIESAKGCEDMFHFFSIFKRRFGGDLDMVLTGQSAMVIPGRDDVHYLGFVSEEEKLAVMQGAVCLVQGSRFESLSIVVLESLMMGTPVLVNGQCPVLRDHVRLSGAGLYYGSADEFCGAVAWLLANPQKRALMGENGREYVAERYHWPELIRRLRGIIDEVSGGPEPEHLLRYAEWLRAAEPGSALQQELLSLQGDDAAIEDRFYRELAFGTGGLRGVRGAGTNRMNVPVVQQAARAVAGWLKTLQGSGATCVVAYDTRLGSREFAEAAAGALAAENVKAALCPGPLPTPFLSYAVRSLGAGAGIVITASHNPAEYNGFKVYGPDGCQITDSAAAALTRIRESLPLFSAFTPLSPEEARARGLLVSVEESVLEDYLRAAGTVSVYAGGERNVPLVYTPLNGTGAFTVPRVLRANGFTDVILPASQKDPDGNFPTCPKPNPELPQAMAEGIRCAGERGAGLVLATDPDADRLGVAVLHAGEYRLLNGSQVGLLLLDFLCTLRQRNGTMPERPLLIKTVVTAPLAEKIAASYGLETVNVLTGFKYIGEQLGLLERSGELRRFVFAFEESCGYLAMPDVRDKDSAGASLLLCEAYVYYREQGLTLIDALEDLQRRFGFEQETLLTFDFPGSRGAATLAALTESLRRTPPASLAGIAVSEVLDHLPGLRGLPPSDTLQFLLSDGSLCTVRPSGTEPKLKIYLSVQGSGESECREKTAALQAYFTSLTEV